MIDFLVNVDGNDDIISSVVASLSCCFWQQKVVLLVFLLVFFVFVFCLHSLFNRSIGRWVEYPDRPTMDRSYIRAFVLAGLKQRAAHVPGNKPQPQPQGRKHRGLFAGNSRWTCAPSSSPLATIGLRAQGMSEQRRGRSVSFRFRIARHHDSLVGVWCGVCTGVFPSAKVLFIVSCVVLGRKQQESCFFAETPTPVSVPVCLFVGAGRAVYVLPIPSGCVYSISGYSICRARTDPNTDTGAE